MKKVCLIFVLILTLVILCGCGGYVKSYSATILITSCHGDEASMEFESFKGNYNFKLRRDGAAEHTLDLEASAWMAILNLSIIDRDKVNDPYFRWRKIYENIRYFPRGLLL